MLSKFYVVIFALKTMLCGCSPEVKEGNFERANQEYMVEKVGKLPSEINESSGLVKVHEADAFYTHNDNGGLPELYKIDNKGNLLETIRIANAENTDWEDLTKDEKGNIYIGDFGNNSQDRKNCMIYKLTEGKTEKITFSYAAQKKFPAEQKIFDCEAFFWYKNRLYLFSKTHQKDFVTYLYSLPDHAGSYQISAQDSIRVKGQITAADINPKQTEFALLAYGKILFFDILNEEINFSKPTKCLKFSHKQTEAIAYINDSDLLVTNEQGSVFLIKKRN